MIPFRSHLRFLLLPLLALGITSLGAGAAAVHRAPVVCSQSGMVVTACPIASSVGREILGGGGNAIDAAVAVGFTLAVTFPAAGNIGGGGFMLIRLESGEAVFIDFREKAPIAASRDMYLDENGDVIPDRSLSGHQAVGVPGSVAGLYRAFQLHGSMPWPDLIAPAISLAKDGFGVSANLSQSLKRLVPYMARYPALKKFARSDERPLEEGDVLKQPHLARTLQTIADKGANGFYRGEVADLIVEEMERGGGLITKEDLSQYDAVVREPVMGLYRGYTILSAPPPSAGGTVLLEILNILEGFPLGEFGYLSEDAVHTVVEAEKRAYSDRAQYLGDPDFINNPLSTLLSKNYAGYLRSSIKWEAVSADRLDRGGITAYEGDETTHYSIMDSRGNAVSTTTTLNSGYGSKVVVGGGGFLLNNEMDDFSIKPGIPNLYGLTGGEANAVAPGKRMLSSMTPTVVLDGGDVFLVLGTPGGSTIITTVAQIIINFIDFGMPASKAVSTPRFHNQWVPDRIDFEKDAFSGDLIQRLERRGHRCRERPTMIGDAQVILVQDSLMCGVSDPRGGGKAEGVRAVHVLK